MNKELEYFKTNVVLRTANLEGFSDTDNLTHVAFGLCSEYGELLEASVKNDMVNAKEELGDLLWYVFLGVSIIDFDIEKEDLKLTAENLDTHPATMLGIEVGNFQDSLKRNIFYGSQRNDVTIKLSLSRILYSIGGICKTSNTTIYDCMKLNKMKLSQRYPDKFSNEGAINRDTKKEREILEDESLKLEKN